MACPCFSITAADDDTFTAAATRTGYWPLYRYDPRRAEEGKNPLQLDSKPPRIPLRDYAYNENRYKVLVKSNPEEAERLMQMAQENVDRRWATYEHLEKQDPAEFERAGWSRVSATQ